MKLRLRLALLAGVTVALAGGVVMVVFVVASRAPATDPVDTFTRAAQEFGLDRERSGRPLPPAFEARRTIVDQLRTPDGRTFEQVLDQLDEERRDAETRATVVSTAIAVAILALATIAAAWLVARRVLRQVGTLTDGARRAAAFDLAPIELAGPRDELRELGDTIDAMLARLDVALAAHRGFAVDVAHELRTPIAAIRSNAELALAEDGNARDRTTLIEAERCAAIIDRFLTIARLQTSHTLVDVDLADVAADVVGRHIEMATEHGVELTLVLDDAVVRGDPVLLGALIENLLRNAIVHNVTAGEVHVRVGVGTSMAQIEMTNTGPVVVDPRRLLERSTRGPDSGGAGVGLSIAASIVAVHHGTLTLDPIETGGLRANVEIPLTRAD